MTKKKMTKINTPGFKTFDVFVCIRSELYAYVCVCVCVLRTAVGVHTVETGSKEDAVMARRVVHDVEDGHGR